MECSNNKSKLFYWCNSLYCLPVTLIKWHQTKSGIFVTIYTILGDAFSYWCTTKLQTILKMELPITSSHDIMPQAQRCPFISLYLEKTATSNSGHDTCHALLHSANGIKSNIECYQTNTCGKKRTTSHFPDVEWKNKRHFDGATTSDMSSYLDSSSACSHSEPLNHRTTDAAEANSTYNSFTLMATSDDALCLINSSSF